MKTFIKLATLSLATLAAAQAHAEGLYVGLGLGGSTMYSKSDFGTNSNATSPVAGITLGYRMQKESYALSFELGADFSNAKLKSSVNADCDTFAQGPYYCDVNSTYRLRGLYSRPTSDTAEWFVGAGLGQVSGTSAIGPVAQTNTSSTGYTLTTGFQKDVSRGAIRFEINYDNFNNVKAPASPFTPKYQATTAKISYIMSF